MSDLKRSQFPLVVPALTDEVAIIQDPAGTPTDAKSTIQSIVDQAVGGVTSVNTKTGDVVLVPDDMNDATSANKFTSQAEIDKLTGIEAGATVDQTGAEIKVAYEGEANTNAYTDAEKTKLTGVEENATVDQTGAEIKAAYEGEADTNAFTDAEQTKLTGIEANATADQTGAEIKVAYEGEADTNAFTDADQTKLAGVEANATVDQTGAEIKAAYEGEADTNAFTDAEQTKVGNAITQLADDATPVLAGTMNADSHLIQALLDPENDQDAATKVYVDDSVEAVFTGEGGLAGSTLEFGVTDDLVPLDVAALDTSPRCFAMSPDGTRGIFGGSASNTLYTFDMPTPGSLVGATFDGDTFAFAPSLPYGVRFSQDGMKLFVMAGSADTIYEYSLAAAFDISVAPVQQGTLNVGGADGTPTGIEFTPDGMKLLFCGDANNRIYEYDLPTPWDLTGATLSGNTLDTSPEDPQMFGCAFSHSGNAIFATGNSDKTFQYDCTTPFDISTASYSGFEYDHGTETVPRDVQFSPDGAKMFMIGQTNDEIVQLSVTAIPADVAATISYVDETFIPKSALVNAEQTVMVGGAGNDPAPLPVPVSTFVGRDSSGNIKALTIAEVQAMLGI